MNCHLIKIFKRQLQLQNDMIIPIIMHFITYCCITVIFTGNTVPTGNLKWKKCDGTNSSYVSLTQVSVNLESSTDCSFQCVNHNNLYCRL